MDKRCTPHSPLTTRLSGSARETENRIRNIFQWKKKRPPALVLALAALVIVLCGSLVSCQEGTTFVSNVASGRVEMCIRDRTHSQAQRVPLGVGRAVGAVVVDEVLHPRRQLDGLVERLLVLLRCV